MKGDPMAEEKTRTEEFHIDGDALLAKVKELLHEGNIRRILIKSEEGKTLVEFPVTLGVVGAILAPQLAAIGAMAALVTKCTLVVEKQT
jgi:CBS domain-containing protein